MEQIFWVVNRDLSEVNKWLQKGGRVKMIQAVTESVSSYGYAGGQSYSNEYGNIAGNIFAYVVVEFD